MGPRAISRPRESHPGQDGPSGMRECRAEGLVNQTRQCIPVSENARATLHTVGKRQQAPPSASTVCGHGNLRATNRSVSRRYVLVAGEAGEYDHLRTCAQYEVPREFGAV